MWKWLHPYAKHETQYHLCGKLSPFFGVIAVLLLAVGIVWGLAYAPADYQQGNSFRIMYVHVPAAIWSMGVYGSMAVAAIIALVWQIKAAHLSMIAMAPIGAIGVALTVGLRKGGVLLSLLVVPLFIPVLIFASAILDAAALNLPYGGQLAILGAILAGAITLSPFAIAAALRISLDN